MFNTKVTFENTAVEYKSLNFSDALHIAEEILDSHKVQPISVEVLEDSKLVASLRVIR